MKHSFPNVKGNVTEVFDIIHKFANDTDKVCMVYYYNEQQATGILCVTSSLNTFLSFYITAYSIFQSKLEE